MTDWNERYRRGEHITDEPHPLLVRSVELLSPGIALDLACGAGRNTIFLAERGWQVTAVDASAVAIELTSKQAVEHGVAVNAVVADLEHGEFVIEPDKYDLVCVCYYLRRELLPQIRAGIRLGGVVFAAIHMVDDSPDVKPMNPAFLLQPGELIAEFPDWEVLHYHEGIPNESAHRRATAEIIARKNHQA